MHLKQILIMMQMKVIVINFVMYFLSAHTFVIMHLKQILIMMQMKVIVINF